MQSNYNTFCQGLWWSRSHSGSTMPPRSWNESRPNFMDLQHYNRKYATRDTSPVGNTPYLKIIVLGPIVFLQRLTEWKWPLEKCGWYYSGRQLSHTLQQTLQGLDMEEHRMKLSLKNYKQLCWLFLLKDPGSPKQFILTSANTKLSALPLLESFHLHRRCVSSAGACSTCLKPSYTAGTHTDMGM